MNNIEKAQAQFNRDFVNFRKIDHDCKFVFIPRLEADAKFMMKKAFAAFAAGKDNMGDMWAADAERFFIMAQLLKDFSTAKTESQVKIASKIRPFNS